MRWSLVPLLAAQLFVLSACGGGSGSSNAPDSDASATTVGSDSEGFQDCLRENGIDPDQMAGIPGAGGFGGPNGSLRAGPPDGGGAPQDNFTRPSFGSRPTDGSLGSRGTIDAATQRALDACQSLMPQGTAGGRDSQSAAIQSYLSCLADNGVVVPTTTAPGATAAGATREPASSGSAIAAIDRSQPAFAAANEKCSVLLPTSGPVPSSTITR